MYWFRHPHDGTAEIGNNERWLSEIFVADLRRGDLGKVSFANQVTVNH